MARSCGTREKAKHLMHSSMRRVKRRCRHWTCPFPALSNKALSAATPEGPLIISGETEEAFTRTGGIELGTALRPKFEDNLCNQLYCAAISFLLHKMPFVQGITSAHEIGGIVSRAILEDIEAEQVEAVSKLDRLVRELRA